MQAVPALDGGPITVVIELEVEPEQQSELLRGLADSVDKYVSRCPGFLYASFHASLDARWRSVAAWKAFLASTTEDDEGQKSREALMARCGAKPVSVTPFRDFRTIKGNGGIEQPRFVGSLMLQASRFR
ncbi:antibiotic biosynthesis monooxygenase family protein [Myxococcus sp. SDU36]|uniref:antibiotic biosynthesis monooxygenase family protein n=1 Tax=Myxococcus sp. SDU36 TaxID=2831967 RepID=UPI002542711D|nr:antibiotic biosynthesis monooxygenase family protein [Myxococcus sp. SDU36]WIG98786.1 antibiotic biosynthesis monooxygenase [Myxococcus sp. SDU36]